MNSKIKKSVSWKNKKTNNNNNKSGFFSKLKTLFTRKKNNSLKQKIIFPNTHENVEARKTATYNTNNNSNNNNNNSTRKEFFSTPKFLRKQHAQNRIAKTKFRGKYFIE